MNENNENYDEHNALHTHHHQDYIHEIHNEHPWISTLMTALLVLLGAFLAFYAVADWHFKRMLDPMSQMKHMERMMMKEDMAMQKMFGHDYRGKNLQDKSFATKGCPVKNLPNAQKIENFIKLDETADFYIITVDLRPFDNDDDNVSVSINNNILTVHAVNEKTQRGNSRMTAVSQSFMFPKGTNFNKISKEQVGDKYIITIPMS